MEHFQPAGMDSCSLRKVYRFRVTADSGRQDAWELFVDGEKIDSDGEQLKLRADRAVDLELRWRDPAVNGSSGDHAVKLEWSLNGGSFQTIDSQSLRTGVTVTSLDVLGSTDLLVPQLNRELYNHETEGWESGVAWGDVDNDGDLDLLHWGFDQLGNGESQILINDADLAGRRLSRPVSISRHSIASIKPNGAIGTVMAGLICW